MTRLYMERSGEMEVFARVVEMGGFSAAAKTLDLTPSAVSKLIARLEARLGAMLLLRTTRSLRLTDEGEAYHRAALEVLQQIDDVEERVTGGAVRGRLRISASLNPCRAGDSHVSCAPSRSLHRPELHRRCRRPCRPED